MIDNETKKHGIQDNISPQKSEDTKPIKYKSTANDKSIPCYESVAAQMAKKGMRLRAWALAKGLSQKDWHVLRLLSTGKCHGKRGGDSKAKRLRAMLESEGFIIPEKVV